MRSIDAGRMGSARMSARTRGASVTPARDTQQGGREIHAHAAGARGAEGARVAAGAAGDVEHPPARLEPGRLDQERDRAGGLGVVAVRVELQVLLTEPLLEPFGHGCGQLPLWYGSPRRIVKAR